MLTGWNRNSKEPDLDAEVSVSILLFLENMILHFIELCSYSDAAALFTDSLTFVAADIFFLIFSKSVFYSDFIDFILKKALFLSAFSVRIKLL